MKITLFALWEFVANRVGTYHICSRTKVQSFSAFHFISTSSILGCDLLRQSDPRPHNIGCEKKDSTKKFIISLPDHD
jgi:hypothetical protein